MPEVIVIGGGLAGLAATAALAGAGFRVRLFEIRGFLGGRATSFPFPSAGETVEVIDNCQHILLGCCVNLLDFYARLSVSEQIRFHREFYFLEPGGRLSVLRPGRAPAPLHFAASLVGLGFLTVADKWALVRALFALRREQRVRRDLDRISMLDWLREKRQPVRLIERLWRPVLVSAVNEELGRMAAGHGFQVLRLGFLAGARASAMGVPAVPLGSLYSPELWRRFETVSIRMRAAVTQVVIQGDAVRGVVAERETHGADFYISALPFDRAGALLPELGLDLSGFEHSPITGIHLWFDRPVTDLPYATLLDRTLQWFFSREEGRYLLAVVSASRGLTGKGRAEVIDLALRELAEFLPLVKEARLIKAHVIKEVKATFSPRPGLEAARPPASTRLGNLFLAGDWTRSGWPATMEGAVRSGYLAAEAVTAAAGRPEKFLVPDLA